jgi:hypothetical protein
MNRAQSNEPDQLVSSTVSITVPVTPARAKKLFAFASVEIDIDGLDRVASVPGANATSGPRCRREQLFGFLARPAAVNTLRQQPMRSAMDGLQSLPQT